MNSHQKTAYCGIYCPDCIRYRNQYDASARQLKNELERVDFQKYAEIDTPFGANFKKYPEFMEVLNALAASQCNMPCRVGGGCSGTPCEIMACCIANKFEGCWECHKVEQCEKFAILQPRCGKMPQNNILKIKTVGITDWVELRDKFYIWQQEDSTISTTSKP